MSLNRRPDTVLTAIYAFGDRICARLDEIHTRLLAAFDDLDALLADLHGQFRHDVEP